MPTINQLICTGGSGLTRKKKVIIFHFFFKCVSKNNYFFLKRIVVFEVSLRRVIGGRDTLDEENKSFYLGS
jgi:hypothetical protein